MADVDIEIVTNIEGLDELERDFTEGGRRAVKKFLSKVEKKAARVLKEALSEEAPVLTGQLADDIHIQTATGDGSLTVRVGPSSDSFYGIFQEFGAPEANVPALHWMENAAKENQNEVLEEYMQAVTDGLEDMKG